jgi:hypothetical protein
VISRAAVICALGDVAEICSSSILHASHVRLGGITDDLTEAEHVPDVPKGDIISVW